MLHKTPSCYINTGVVEKMNKDTAQTLWIMLLKKHFRYSPILESKMSKIRFDKEGETIEQGRAWKYTVKHFPSLIDKFNEWRDK